MSKDLAYSMLLIYQRQARDLREQHLLLQLFQTYVGGELTAEQYERNVRLTTAVERRAAFAAARR
jgi:hypothetical protein